MRIEPQEKYGKLIMKVQFAEAAKGIEDNLQIREKRKYKDQGRGKNPLIVGSELCLTRGKKKVVKSGFSNVEEIFNYIIKDMLGEKNHNLIVK